MWWIGEVPRGEQPRGEPPRGPRGEQPRGHRGEQPRGECPPTHGLRGEELRAQAVPPCVGVLPPMGGPPPVGVWAVYAVDVPPDRMSTPLESAMDITLGPPSPAEVPPPMGVPSTVGVPLAVAATACAAWTCVGSTRVPVGVWCPLPADSLGAFGVPVRGEPGGVGLPHVGLGGRTSSSDGGSKGGGGGSLGGAAAPG